MPRRTKPPTMQELANNIARDVARRGWPAEAKPAAIRTPFGDIIRWLVIIPRRGIAVIDSELHIVVASSNQLDSPARSFDHTTAKADAEQTLRNLPLP